MSVLASPGRRTLRWSLYDAASSSFVALVPTFFGLYFVEVVAAAHPGAVAYWGLLVAASIMLAGVLAPVVGAFADRTGRWLAILAAMTVVCVGAMTLLPQAVGGHALVACAGFLVAQVSYTLATNIYDSLVLEVAPAGKRGLASGVGWALGLCGGVISILAALAVVRGLPADAQARGLGNAFLIAAILFGVLAVPGLIALRGLRPARHEAPAAGSALAASLRDVIETLRNWREHRETLRVLASYFLINDVIVTLVFFITIMFSTRFGVTVEGMLRLSLVFHAIAIPSTIAAGLLADRWSARSTLRTMTAVLAAAILLMALLTFAWVPLVAVALLGLVAGSIQALFRSHYASLVESDRAAQLFGFNSLAGRLSAAVGPVVFGSAATALGSQSLALFTLLVPLAAGVALLGSAPARSGLAPARGAGPAQGA